MSHTILLIQPTSKPESRTYSDYETKEECMESVCKIFEEYLKRSNPSTPSITYDISQLFDYIDSLTDLTCLVRCQKEPYYEPHNKEWIKENIYVMLRKQAGKWQHQTSTQSLHSWEFCTRLWSCFSDSLKIVFFQMQHFCFPIHSQVTFNADKHVRELLMERFGMATGFCQTVSKVRITYCTK